MKKFLIAAAGAIALSLPLSLTPAAAAPDISGLCKAFGDLGLSHGECVSLVQTRDERICQSLREDFPDLYRDVFGNNGIGVCKRFFFP